MTPVSRALLIGVASSRRRHVDLDELEALARSAGLQPTLRVMCSRSRADPATRIGSGKVEEILRQIAAEHITEVVFDEALSAVHQRNLHRVWQVPVLDRTELILEIFARRAISQEGQAQVELARLQHQSTRLVRMWTHLERQRGGIGVRGGPGERQIELDRRMLDTRIRRLRERLGALALQRRTRRKARDRHGAFKVSLVGYTNAGKSTLFNALVGSQAPAYAADQLFATLDTLSRRVRLGEGNAFVLSDTVGFVRDLPHSLVDAFQATLEETAEADLLLHLIDASSPERERQCEAVEAVLREIGAGEVPVLKVYNKCDRCGLAPRADRDPYGRIFQVHASAQTRAGIDLIREAIFQALTQAAAQVTPRILPEAIAQSSAAVVVGGARAGGVAAGRLP
ncbi:MAG: GTPase HflX [Betaproteobacteria bacterium]